MRRTQVHSENPDNISWKMIGITRVSGHLKVLQSDAEQASVQPDAWSSKTKVEPAQTSLNHPSMMGTDWENLLPCICPSLGDRVWRVDVFISHPARSSSSRGRDIVVRGARAGLVASFGLVAGPLRMDWVLKLFSRTPCESEVEHPEKKILGRRISFLQGCSP